MIPIFIEFVKPLLLLNSIYLKQAAPKIKHRIIIWYTGSYHTGLAVRRVEFLS